jgi:uncharacterized RmlC-like cupin family protein
MILRSKFLTKAFSYIILEVTLEFQGVTYVSSTAVSLSNLYISFVIVTICSDISTKAHWHSTLETAIVDTTIDIIGSAMTMGLSRAPLTHVN